MKYKKLILAVSIITLGVVLGVVFQNDLFGVFLFAFSALYHFFPIPLVLALIALGFKLARRPIGKILSYSLIVSCSCVVSLLAVIETGSLINRWKVDAVESYVARAVPVLDQIKREKGAYPSELPTDILGKPPELLRLYGDYKVTGSDFCFEYDNNPAEWAGGEGPQMFDSSSRKWMDDR